MLTEMQVKNARARERDYKLADSEGLYLYVTAKGHRSWRMKYRFAGKERRLVLGAYPDLGLREARDRKADARKRFCQSKCTCFALSAVAASCASCLAPESQLARFATSIHRPR